MRSDVNSDFVYINIREYLGKSTENEVGESELSLLLADYSCPLNNEVNDFLHKSAIEFTRKNQSVTYLVFPSEGGALAGYFTIALKSLTIHGINISNTVKRKLSRISDLDEDTGTYTMSAYLIAQIGKNFNTNKSSRISGKTLLDLSLDVIRGLQYAGGGVVVFLESESNDKLIKFYEDYGFKKFDVRLSKSERYASRNLVQMLKLI